MNTFDEKDRQNMQAKGCWYLIHRKDLQAQEEDKDGLLNYDTYTYIQEARNYVQNGTIKGTLIKVGKPAAYNEDLIFVDMKDVSWEPKSMSKEFISDVESAIETGELKLPQVKATAYDNETKEVEAEVPLTEKTTWFILSKSEIEMRGLTIGSHTIFHPWVKDESNHTVYHPWKRSPSIVGILKKIGDDVEYTKDLIWVEIELKSICRKKEKADEPVKAIPMEVLEVDGVKPQPTKSQINSKLNTGSSGGDIISKIVVLKNIIKLAEERRDRAIERIKDDKRRLKKLEKMLDDFKKL